jgi:hypothetical protein
VAYPFVPWEGLSITLPVQRPSARAGWLNGKLRAAKAGLPPSPGSLHTDIQICRLISPIALAKMQKPNYCYLITASGNRVKETPTERETNKATISFHQKVRLNRDSVRWDIETHFLND